MASSTEYAQQYQQALKAYFQGEYDKAAGIIDHLAHDHPDDPSYCLLRGHVYCGLQQYDVAREQYQRVLGLTSDPQFVENANSGLANLDQFSDSADYGSLDPGATEEMGFQDGYPSADPLGLDPQGGSDDWQMGEAANPFDVADLGIAGDDPLVYDSGAGSQDFASPFVDPFGENSYGSENGESFSEAVDPFATYTDDLAGTNGSQNYFSMDDQNGYGEANYGAVDNHFEDQYTTEPQSYGAIDENGLSDEYGNAMSGGYSSPGPASTNHGNPTYGGNNRRTNEEETLFMNQPADTAGSSRYPEVGGGMGMYTQDDQTFVSSNSWDGFSLENDFNPPNTAEDTYSSNNGPSTGGTPTAGTAGPSTADFLDEFDDFDDLGSLPVDFDLSESSAGFTSPSIGSATGFGTKSKMPSEDGGGGFSSGSDRSTIRDDEVFSITTTEQLPDFVPAQHRSLEPTATVEQGPMAFFENASLNSKRWMTALAAGIASLLAVGVVTFGSSSLLSKDQPDIVPKLRLTGLAMAGVSGLASFIAVLSLGHITVKQIKRSTDDLQSQFNAVCQNNLDTRATVYSEDEFGQLAMGFNNMARVILTTTSEAQRKAEEQEQAK
ncbi:MAG: HAMP domain-containing protein, partial [Leptolyngbyaceae cyanobacterium bins.59]|nr:HAMP domain-containing protein [Leptolyngbyaceae cyanobacterium bins.59]